jgi:hypothetical protein
VVGANDLVAVRHAGALAEKQGAVVPHAVERLARLGGEDLDVLGRVLVGECVGRGEVRHDDYLAVIAPGRSGEIRGRQVDQDLVDQRHDPAGEGFERGDQHRRGVGAVLGLAQQVNCHDERVGVLVGDHQDLGRAGQQVDTDLAEQLPLGLGDVGVARAGQQVDLSDRLGPDRHRGDGLRAAEQEDLVRAGEVQGCDGLGGDLSADRRGAGRYPRNAGDFGGDDRHVGRGDQGIAAAGDVGSRGRDRYVLLPEEHAGLRLDLEIVQRFLLQLGEVAHPRLDRLDVLDRLPRNGRDDLFDRLGVQPELGGRPAVELLGVLADRGVAALADVGDDLGDGLADLFSSCGVFGGLGRGLEVVAHRPS